MQYKEELSQQGFCRVLQRNTSPAHLKQNNQKQQDRLRSVSVVYFITQQQSFASLSEKKKWLTYFCNVALTNPTSHGVPIKLVRRDEKIRASLVT